MTSEQHGEVVHEVTVHEGETRHRWVRNCPQCERGLEKVSPEIRLFCQCGWEWA